MSEEKNVTAKTKPPEVIGTKPIYLSRSKPLRAVNLLVPPGISTFYVERLDRNHIRFLIRTDEIMRLTKKSKKLEKAVEAQDSKKS